MRDRVLCALLVVWSIGIRHLWAVPETSLSTALSFTGSIAGTRFGSEVACSQPVSGISRVAVGAPLAESERGEVYLFNPAAGTEPTQLIAPDVGEVVSRFGAAIQFIDDINSDGVDDLVIGAPGAAGVAAGKVFAFRSSIVGGVLQYQRCGVTSGGLGFGERLQAVREAGGASGANLVVANPEISELAGFMVFLVSGGGCQFSPETAFTQSSVMGTRYGASLAQVAAGGGGVASIAVAAPDDGALGVAAVLRDLTVSIPLPVLGGGPTPIAGVARNGSMVAGFHGSGLYAVGAPQSDSERGLVSIYPSGDEVSPALCTVAVPGAQPADRLGSTVAHLNDSFSALVGAGNIAVAASRSDADTGGSVVIFGASSAGCSALHSYNNCQNDPFQEQGAVITGGASCVTVVGGFARAMLLVGSPGWNGERGRVDIAVEGGELGTAAACSGAVTTTPTLSATPESTVTPVVTPILNPTLTVTPQPTATATPAPTWTATPVYTQAPPTTPIATTTSTPTGEKSPQPSPSVTPTSWVSTPRATPPGDGTPGDGGQVVIDSTPTPVAVFPGASGLPTPEVREVGGVVEVRLPEVAPQLSTRDRTRAVRLLLRKNKRISRRRAEALLENPDNLVVTYIVQYSVVEQARISRFSLIQSAHAAPRISNKSTKIKKIRTRSRSVALGRIQRGGAYRISYQVEIALKKPRVVIGTTRLSVPTVFKPS